MKLPTLTFGLLMLTGTSLLAEPYRLIPGDRVTLNYNLIADARDALVDFDGNIRLSGLGRVVASGQTLDELQAGIAQAMVTTGFNGVPFVSVEIKEYAPVVVSGLVVRSGVFPYIPGMTAGVALAMSGNNGSTSNAIANSEIAVLAVRRRIDALGAQIASAVAQIARLQAGLAGPDVPITPSNDLTNAVPDPETSLLANLLLAEDRLLTTERNTTRELMLSWDMEISDNQSQIKLLDARIVIKSETVAQLTREVDAARNLQSKGLATNTQTSLIIQRLSDEREELLALETTKLTVQRARAVAERARQQYASDLTTKHLQELGQAQGRLNLLRGDRAFALNELMLMSAQTGTVPVLDNALALKVKLQGPRAGRVGGSAINSDTLLLPGDILVIDAIQ